MEIIFQPLDLTLGKSVYVIDGKIIYYWIYQPKIIGINLLYFSSILWLVSYLIILVLKSKKNTKNKNLNLQQKIFLWGIILVFILSPVVFTIGMLMTDQFAKFIWIAIISRTSVNIGLSFFIIAYIKSNNKLDFFQSQPIYGLYLLDMRKKKVIYDRLFRGNLNFEIIDYLTNNLESLNSMLSEIINVDARIRAIELDNYDLLIGEIENSDLVVIIHVKYQTAVILNRFQTLIEAISSIQNYSRNSIKLIINDIFGV